MFNYNSFFGSFISSLPSSYAMRHLTIVLGVMSAVTATKYKDSCACYANNSICRCWVEWECDAKELCYSVTRSRNDMYELANTNFEIVQRSNLTTDAEKSAYFKSLMDEALESVKEKYKRPKDACTSKSTSPAATLTWGGDDWGFSISTDLSSSMILGLMGAFSQDEQINLEDTQMLSM
ncbi:hypothetical protein [Legionella shakespearei]|uniref:Uncharacterized protein n=1 Tax=Legionella shakespearei DSM 23087 TaxID=1122169 RepID=A0A0W0Z634_9GAMM|nr:hypothetical protein [Legionella shakespearei]KTD64616.1 hypothetical protein Lsha_0555 [Legionella shakespearei DSM 23087]